MNIHLPAILMWTTGVQGFDPSPHEKPLSGISKLVVALPTIDPSSGSDLVR